MQNNEEFIIKPSTLETIDTGFFEYVRDGIDAYTVTNNGFEKVPVIWVSPERAYQVKADSALRDSVGRIKLPVITVERSSVQKDPTFKGPIQADMRGPNPNDPRWYRGGAFHVKRTYNQQRTSKWQSLHVGRNLKNGQEFHPGYDESGVCYDDYYIPVPTYVAITYSINLRAEYQQQMNDMLIPFITRPGQVNHFVFMKDGHKFEAFVQQDFSQENNLTNMGEEERKFHTKIEIKVLGYLIGQGINEPRPKIIKRHSVVKLAVVQEVETSDGDEDDVGDGSTVQIGDQCFVKRAVSVLSEEDLSVFQQKTPILDDSGVDTGETEWTTLDGYEPGKGQLKINTSAGFNKIGVACADDASTGVKEGDILDSADKIPEFKEF